RRAHARGRFDHAPHRPARERLVTAEHAAERVRRRETRQQAHRRAGIRAIERSRWRTEATESAAVDADQEPARADRSTDGDAVRFETRQRRDAISAREISIDMLDVVQVLSDRMGQMAALDEDSVHWIGVAVRESVINAIKHGNREHPQKLVTIEFSFTPLESPTELVVSVIDQGEGFDPESV